MMKNVFKKIWITGMLLQFLMISSFATTYYVDATNGNDSNNGTSTSTAWKTLGKVMSTSFSPNDFILFKRGEVFRGGGYSFEPPYGTSSGSVTYADYGTGNKPRMYGSVQKKNTSDWTNVGTNIWQASLPNTADAGSLIFNNEASWGEKVSSVSLLTSQGKFYCNTTGQYVRLYSVGNPASYYSNIEIALNASVIYFWQSSYVTLKNLDIRYGGAHGIGSGGGVHHIVIQSCDFSFIGGAYQVEGDTGRYGNGVEFWQAAHDCTVKQCTFSQIYDAAITSQGVEDAQAYSAYNLYFINNIIDKAEYSFEFWFHGSNGISTHDVYFANNTCLNAGMGWAHSQRSDPNGSHLTFWGFDANVTVSNIFIRNNIFKNVTGAGIFEANDVLADLSTSKMTINNNDWYVTNQLSVWGTYHDWSYYRTNTGQDANSVITDPLLNTDNTLSSTSPCINTGVTLSTVTSDFIDVARPQGSAYDMGAYEYTGTSIAVTGVTASPTTSSVNVGDNQQLTATIVPTNATNKTVTWSSSNTAIATVSSSGLITGISSGTAIITVTTQDGGFTATCTASVSAATNLALNKTTGKSSQSSSTYSSSKAVDGSTSTQWRSNSETNPWIYVDLAATYNITRVKLSWSTYYGTAYKIQTSADASTWTDIATLTGQNGGTDDNTGLSGSGRYVRIYVTARSNSSQGVRLIEFEVYGTASTVSVTGVTVNPTTSSVNVGATQQLTATVAPSNATNQTVTWSSSNTAIATVSTSGLVTGVASGTATITVTTSDGGFNATCAVAVNAATNLLLNPGFESGTTSWTANASTIASSTTQYHSGTKGLSVTARTQTYGGPAQDVTTSVAAIGAGTYHVEAWVKMASGTSTVYVTLKYTVGGVDYYASTAGTSVSTTWTHISEDLSVSYAGTLQSFVYYIETASCTTSFYTDDCVLNFTGLKSLFLSSPVNNVEIPKITLYPNPAANSITIELTDKQENEKLQIYNTSGILVKEVNVSALIQRIKVEDLPGGIYIVRSNNSRSLVAKFIKK